MTSVVRYLLMGLLVAGTSAAAVTLVVPDRTWANRIPDPDTFDWSRIDRPGYHYAGMTPLQEKFHAYVVDKRKSGTPLSQVDEMMVRRMIALRAWPEPPRPSEFWKAFMRYMRGLKTKKLNAAQQVMLSQLFAAGLSGYDPPENDTTRKVAQYLSSGPFRPRNWFEHVFGRVEPWLRYEYAAAGHEVKPLGAPPSNVYPGDGDFNGMVITYDVGGATLGAAVDRPGFTTARSLSGTFTPGGKLSVSGTVKVGGYGADLRVHVYAGSENKEYKAWIENKGSASGTFSVSIPIPKDAEKAGFTIQMDGKYSMGGGHRGLIVGGAFELDEAGKAARARAAEAEWRKKVEETLKQLGSETTEAGRELDAMRKALAGGDEAWKRYCQEQEAKLGYGTSPGAQAFLALERELDSADAPGGVDVPTVKSAKPATAPDGAAPPASGGGTQGGTRAEGGAPPAGGGGGCLITFDDEQVAWEGPCPGGAAGGSGTARLSGGTTYVGEAAQGKASGVGTFTKPGRYTYQGYWKDGRMEGVGIYAWTSGDRYDGEMQGGKFDGQGTYTWAGGARYEGQWKDDQRNGQGTYTAPDGSRYVGGFRNGKRDGRGTLYLPDGRAQAGVWREGKKVQ